MTSSPRQYHQDLSYDPSSSGSITSEESYEFQKLSQPPYRGSAATDSTGAGSLRSSHRKTNFLKVVIIGDSNVGKTTLIENFQYKRVKEIQRPTVGADFMKKIVKLSCGKEVPLQIWDTAGQERFQSLSSTFYRGTDCCVIVFDLCNYKSFMRLKTWRNNFVESQGYDEFDDLTVPIILVGNKTDLAEHCREVSVEQVLQEWIDTGLANNYIETSAFTSQNVDQCFSIVAEEAREYQINTQDNMNRKSDLHSDIMQQLVSLEKVPLKAHQRNSEEIKSSSPEQSTQGSSDGDIYSDDSPSGYSHNRKFKLKSKKHSRKNQEQPEVQQYSGSCCYFV